MLTTLSRNLERDCGLAGGAGPEDCVAVMKRHKSGIDFLKSPSEDKGGMADWSVRHMRVEPDVDKDGQADWDKYWDHDDDGLFALCGLRFGVEVCPF